MLTVNDKSNDKQKQLSPSQRSRIQCVQSWIHSSESLNSLRNKSLILPFTLSECIDTGTSSSSNHNHDTHPLPLHACICCNSSSLALISPKQCTSLLSNSSDDKLNNSPASDYNKLYPLLKKSTDSAFLNNLLGTILVIQQIDKTKFLLNDTEIIHGTCLFVIICSLHKDCSHFSSLMHNSLSTLYATCILIAHKMCSDHPYSNKSYAHAFGLHPAVLSQFEYLALQLLDWQPSISTQLYNQAALLYSLQFNNSAEELHADNRNINKQADISRVLLEEVRKFMQLLLEHPSVKSSKTPAIEFDLSLFEKSSMPSQQNNDSSKSSDNATLNSSICTAAPVTSQVLLPNSSGIYPPPISA